MVNFDKQVPPMGSVENGEDAPEIKEIPEGKRFYRINNRGEIEFLENPFKVPETDPNAEK